MSLKVGKREKPQPKRRSAGTAAAILAVVAALALAAAAAWRLLVVAPDVSDNDTPGVSSSQHTDANVDSGADTAPDETGAAPVSKRKKDFYTFILLGKDTGGGGNTDTMLFVSYDVPNGTIDLVSIPRDTMINVKWNIKKINAVYASSRGIEGLKEEIGYLTGVMPDFYVTVEWEAIGEIVDALEGVWFDVPFDMNYDDPYQDLYIHQEKGYRLLSGDDAMQVIRFRKNNGEKYGIGDTGRQKVQQDFLKAVASQCLQIGNWTKVSAFAEIFFRNVETDIPLNNLLWFAQNAMGLKMENINFHSLPGNDEGWYYTPSIKDNLAYFFADPAGIAELVNAHFNPYNREITEDDLVIVFKNKDASLGVTNGELADPSMAIPSVKPPSPPKEDDDAEKDDTEEEEPALPDSEEEQGGEDEPSAPGEPDSGSEDENGGGSSETSDETQSENASNGEIPSEPTEPDASSPGDDATQDAEPELPDEPELPPADNENG